VAGGERGNVHRAPYNPAVDLPSEGNESSGSTEFDEIRRELIAAAAPAQLVAFVDAMNAQGLPVASVADALAKVRPFLDGPVSGYKMARALGLSPEEAKAQPATAAALEIREILGADAFDYDEVFEQRGFRFEKDAL
jgi:hypothetical protein